MAHRQPRPQQQSGVTPGRRASIDLGGIAGAMGATTPTGGSLDTPTNTGGGANGEDLGGSGPLMTKASPSSGPGFTPFQASGWQNLLTRGQAGMNAASLNAELMKQVLANSGAMNVTGLQGSQQLEQIGAKGGEERKTLGTAGEQERQTLAKKAVNAWMAANNLPDDPDGNNFQIAQKALFHPSMGVLAEKLKSDAEKARTSGLAAKVTNTAYEAPGTQEAATSGLQASLTAPVAENFKKAVTLSPLETALFPPNMNLGIGYGSTPGGSSNTETTAFDPKTGLKTTTTKTTPTFNRGGGGSPRIPIIQDNGSNSPSTFQIPKTGGLYGDNPLFSSGSGGLQTKMPATIPPFDPTTNPNLNYNGLNNATFGGQYGLGSAISQILKYLNTPAYQDKTNNPQY